MLGTGSGNRFCQAALISNTLFYSFLSFFSAKFPVCVTEEAMTDYTIRVRVRQVDPSGGTVWQVDPSDVAYRKLALTHLASYTDQALFSGQLNPFYVYHDDLQSHQQVNRQPAAAPKGPELHNLSSLFPPMKNSTAYNLPFMGLQ